jgi:hypothetical protein
MLTVGDVHLNGQCGIVRLRILAEIVGLNGYQAVLYVLSNHVHRCGVRPRGALSPLTIDFSAQRTIAINMDILIEALCRT